MVSESTTFSFHLLKPRYWGTWLAVGMLLPLGFCPAAWRIALAQRLANIVFKHNRKRREVVCSNLRIVNPQWNDDKVEAEALVHFRWHFQGLLDYSLLLFRSNQWLYQHIQIQNKAYLDRLIEQGHNVVILLSHTSSLDFAPIGLSQYYTVYGSYNEQKNAVIDWLMARMRSRHVEHLISRSEGMQKMVRLLEPGKLMILLADEDLGIKNSVFAPFFNTEKATLTSPIRIAKLKQAVCVPAFTCYSVSNNQYNILLGEPLHFDYNVEHRFNAQKINQALEKLIQHEPNQYMWMLKLYRTQPEGASHIYN